MTEEMMVPTKEFECFLYYREVYDIPYWIKKAVKSK